MKRFIARLQVLLVKELRDLARDRKVFCTAILLPALLFPVLLSLTGKYLVPATQSEINLRIGITGHGELIDEIVRDATWASWAAGGDEESVRSGELDAVLVGDYSGRQLLRFRVLYDKSNPNSVHAVERLSEALGTSKAKMRRVALEAMALGKDKLPPERVEWVDLADHVHAGNPAPSSFLPSMLILMMLAAAAFAAIDLFAGERERGTFETLLVQPIGAREILFGKYLAVFATGYTAVLANIGGIALASTLENAVVRMPLSATSLLGTAFVAIPTSMLVAAVLVRIVSRAASVTEAQHYLLPLTLAGVVPALIAAAPEIEFTVLSAALPMAGPALAMRSLGLGQIDAWPLIVMLSTTTLYSVLLLSGCLRHLSQDAAILSNRPVDSDASSSRAIGVALFAILSTFLSAPFLQSAHVSLRVLIPMILFTALPAALLSKSVGLRLKLTPSRKKPRARSWILAIATGVGIAMTVTGVSTLQHEILPPPVSFDRSGAELLVGLPSLAVALLILAIVPAIAEELLYRRFVLHGLRKSLDRNRAILVTAALFALHHLSVYRFLPSFLAGVVLGHLVMRSHRFWLAPVAHATSNGLIVLLAHPTSPLEGSDVAKFASAPDWAFARLAIGAALIFGTPYLLDRRSVWSPRASNAAS